MFRQKSLQQRYLRRVCISAFGIWLFLVNGLPLFGADSGQDRGLFYYVVDRSGSITAYGLTEPIRSAITEHAAQLPEGTEVRLVFFSRTASEPQRWPKMTPEAKTNFGDYFKRNFIPEGPTRLYDTVGEVMEEIRASDEDYGFVSILVFSDGENNWSRTYRSWNSLEPLYTAMVERHEQSFLYWITLEFDPAEPPPPWVIHEPQPPGTTDIPIPEPLPLADFAAHPQQLKEGEEIQFEYIMRGGRVTEFLWDFGDGNTSVEQNPTHQYERDGTYTVILRTIGPGGEAEEVKEDFVHVAPVIPLKAGFRLTSDRVRIGDVLRLQDVSEGNPEAWEWSLEGEVFSTDAAPSLATEVAGDLTVLLTVRRGDEADSFERLVTVLPPPPEAAFSIRPEEVDYGEPVHLSANETLESWEHRWVIDGEITLEGARAEWISDRHGLLHVVHSVEGPGGFSQHADRLFVHPPVEILPDTGFSMSHRVFVEGDRVTFTAKESGEGRTHQWLVDGDVVGEGATFEWESDRRGNLVITHRILVSDTEAVFDELDEVHGRAPELVRVAFSASKSFGTYPLTVEFTDTSEGDGVGYRWDFGDGNESNQRNPTHTYEEAGEYNVILAVTNRQGEVTTNFDPVVLSVVPPMPIWQKALLGLLIAVVLWVVVVVPYLLRPMLAPQRGPKLIGMKTYPLHMSARKSWTRFLWPKTALTIGSSVESDIRLPNAGGTRGDLALIERAPAASNYSIRPLAGNEIYKIEKQTSLLNPGVEEKAKVGRGRVLRDGDTYEIAGERLVWCQPRKRVAKAAAKKKPAQATRRKFTFSNKKNQALAK